MKYSELVEAYSKLEKNSSRLKKTKIISDLLKNAQESELEMVIYLIQGRVFPSYDPRKIGFSERLAIKALASATGNSAEKVEKEFSKKGDLGTAAIEFTSKKSQTTLSLRDITVEKVFDNIRKLATLEGQGTVNRKIQLVTELLTSANPEEAKFIIRTILEQLRVGVSSGVLRDAIAWTFFPKVKGINEQKEEYKKILNVKNLEEIKSKNIERYDLVESEDEKINREIYNYFISVVQKTFDVKNDFAEVARYLKKYSLESSEQAISPGSPINSMLAIKVESVEDSFKAVGKPAFYDLKLDGFRLQLHKNKDEIKLFTRNLEDVTKQFPDVIEFIKTHVKGDSFIIDAEAVGYDLKTKAPMPFQAVSQRIKRKHHIEEMVKKIPIQVFVFDILFYNGENLMDRPFRERRKIIEEIIKEEKNKIQLTEKLVTDSDSEVKKFYKKVLSRGFEGLMGKKLDSPYKPGRYVEGWVKLKPTLEPLDLTVVSAEYGEGKRTGWLTSYTVACKSGDKLLEIGKVSTGVKEKSEGMTYKEMTKLLKPLIISQKGKEVKLKPKIVIEVGYEEIQKSPTYSSGYALRFPRFLRERTSEKSIKELNTLNEIEKMYKNQKKFSSKS